MENLLDVLNSEADEILNLIEVYYSVLSQVDVQVNLISAAIQTPKFDMGKNKEDISNLIETQKIMISKLSGVSSLKHQAFVKKVSEANLNFEELALNNAELNNKLEKVLAFRVSSSKELAAYTKLDKIKGTIFK